jgi:hypothetical protein
MIIYIYINYYIDIIMMSINDTDFIMKYDFDKNKIRKGSIVKIQAIINNCCLIEDIKTLDRDWVMDYEIFPINDIHYYGNWEHTAYNVKTHLQNVI